MTMNMSGAAYQPLSVIQGDMNCVWATMEGQSKHYLFRVKELYSLRHMQPYNFFEGQDETCTQGEKNALFLHCICVCLFLAVCLLIRFVNREVLFFLKCSWVI